MVILEPVDHNMLGIIDIGPHIPTYEDTKYGVKIGVIKKTHKHLLN